MPDSIDVRPSLNSPNGQTELRETCMLRSRGVSILVYDQLIARWLDGRYANCTDVLGMERHLANAVCVRHDAHRAIESPLE